jgi:hypothetical protein
MTDIKATSRTGLSTTPDGCETVQAGTAGAPRQWRLIIPAPVTILSFNAEKDWAKGRNHKAWRETAYAKAAQAQMPKHLALIRVDLELRFPTARGRRNETNYHPTVGKPCVDALGPQRQYVIQRGVRAGTSVLERGWFVIDDDTSPPLHCPDCPHIRFGVPLTPGERLKWRFGVAVMTVTDLSGSTSC